MPPFHVGSNMAHEVEMDHAVFEKGALKFQAGTPDVAGPVGLAAAVRFLEASMPQLRSHDDRLVQHGLSRLSRIPGLRLLGPPEAANRIPVFTFVLAGHQPSVVARALDERGIAVRAGDMAALPLLKRFRTAEALRASAYVYSTTEDLDRLADALTEIAK
jgi:cysteine desulfurase / selenocysteine lyase